VILTSFSKDLILEFLQDMFSQQDLYDGKNDYVWSPDPEESKILIADAYTEDLETAEMRPAIVLRRGPIRWMQTSIDQRANVDFRTGRRTFQDLLASDLTAECLSRNGLEAELLADIVFQGIQIFASTIRHRGAFEVDSVAIGPETLIQGDSQQDLSAVPVGIRLLLQKSWQVNVDGVLLDKFRGFNSDPRSGKLGQVTEISKE